MRVLIAAPHNPLNPYCRELGRGYYEQGCEVLYGLDQFWTGHAGVDIVHLHWPEMLAPVEFDAAENARRIGRRLDEWRRTATVIATVHNSEPHVPFDGWHEVFESSYSQCDGIVHHGERSRQWFAGSFPRLGAIPSAIVPHGNYLCFPSGVSRARARERLGLGQDDRVVVVFGRTRTGDELRLLGSGLRKAKVPRLHLLLSDSFQVRRLGWIRNVLARRWHLAGVQYRLFPGVLPPGEVGTPLAAADLLVVQRQSGLNSGNVPLAFSFGLPVVSADTGVFGELVKKHGNFTFAPGRAEGLAASLERAFSTDLPALGLRNRAVAENEWSWSAIARQVLDFISRLSPGSVSA